MDARVRICFVCLGNICRSPTAEGVMRHLLREAGLETRVHVDSAGTGDWHVGEAPDPRSVAAARTRGVSVGGAARQFRRRDFARFDLVLAMDGENLEVLEELAPGRDAVEKVALLRDFDASTARGADVPDPYYGGDRGFEDVLDICEAACRGLLAHLRARYDFG